jgi:hypothetical protein
MKIDKDFKEPNIDAEKTSEVLDKILEVLRENKLNTLELIVLLSNLGYSIGASLEGFQGNGPSFEELQKMYYSNPTVGVALMNQAMLMSSWLSDLIEKG